jgi:hypothetical protein
MDLVARAIDKDPVVIDSVAAVRLTTNRLHKTGYAVHHGFHNLT